MKNGLLFQLMAGIWRLLIIFLPILAGVGQFWFMAMAGISDLPGIMQKYILSRAIRY